MVTYLSIVAQEFAWADVHPLAFQGHGDRLRRELERTQRQVRAAQAALDAANRQHKRAVMHKRAYDALAAERARRQ